MLWVRWRTADGIPHTSLVVSHKTYVVWMESELSLAMAAFVSAHLYLTIAVGLTTSDQQFVNTPYS
jgi:hypothetical protein